MDPHVLAGNGSASGGFRQSAGGISHIAIANHVEHSEGVVIKVGAIGYSAFGLQRCGSVVVDCSHVMLSTAT